MALSINICWLKVPSTTIKTWFEGAHHVHWKLEFDIKCNKITTGHLEYFKMVSHLSWPTLQSSPESSWVTMWPIFWDNSTFLSQWSGGSRDSLVNTIISSDHCIEDNKRKVLKNYCLQVFMQKCFLVSLPFSSKYY